MTLEPAEFIRRFLLHVLPSGFHRIRHYGFFASSTRAVTIDRLRELIAAGDSTALRAAKPPFDADPPVPDGAAAFARGENTPPTPLAAARPIAKSP